MEIMNNNSNERIVTLRDLWNIFVQRLIILVVVGAIVAAGGYLPIAEGSALYSLLFSGFNLAWFFYLPSQVLLALRTTK